MAKKGVLLIQLGTPDSPEVGDVRRYLKEFLSDPMVLEMSSVGRWALVNLILVPFRGPKSAKVYQELWDRSGGESPLLTHTLKLQDLLKGKLDADTSVYMGMRYQKPPLRDAIAKAKADGVDELVVLPLYPQYADASTGSSLVEARKIMKELDYNPKVEEVEYFFDNPKFIETWKTIYQEQNYEEFDRYLISYHGLPLKSLCPHKYGEACIGNDCANNWNDRSKMCYHAQCGENTRLLIDALGLPEDKTVMGFQSRLTKEWVEPFSDQLVIKAAKEGVKKMLVFSPAFVADCLETLIEIEDEYQELFQEHGGEKIVLVPSLNSHPAWVDTVKELVAS